MAIQASWVLLCFKSHVPPLCTRPLQMQVHEHVADLAGLPMYSLPAPLFSLIQGGPHVGNGLPFRVSPSFLQLGTCKPYAGLERCARRDLSRLECQYSTRQVLSLIAVCLVLGLGAVQPFMNLNAVEILLLLCVGICQAKSCALIPRMQEVFGLPIGAATFAEALQVGVEVSHALVVSRNQRPSKQNVVCPCTALPFASLGKEVLCPGALSGRCFLHGALLHFCREKRIRKGTGFPPALVCANLTTLLCPCERPNCRRWRETSTDKRVRVSGRGDALLRP